MAETRSKTAFVFRPQGDETQLSLLSRARFAMLGANGVTEVTPDSQPQLYSLLEHVSEKAGMHTPKAYIWHSKKPIANAVAMPTAVPTIAFSEKITELLNPEELAAVAGHELGHVKNMSHSGKLFWLSAFGGMAIGDMIGRPIQRQIRQQMQSGHATPLLAAADTAVMAARFLAPVAAGAVATRSEELAADRHGAYTMDGDAVPLLSGLQKLVEYNEQTFRPTVLGKIMSPITRVTRSHPEFEQRRTALGVSKEDIAGYRATHDMIPAVQAVQKEETPTRQAQEPQGEWQRRVSEQAATRDAQSATR